MVIWARQKSAGRWDLGSAGVFGSVSGFGEDQPMGWGLWGRAAGPWGSAQDWEDGEGSHGAALGQGGPGAREDCGAVGLGMGEELGLWGWSWRKGGSVAVGLECGDMGVLSHSLWLQHAGCWEGGDTSMGEGEGNVGPIAGMF